jgi:hypothetical protein
MTVQNLRVTAPPSPRLAAAADAASLRLLGLALAAAAAAPADAAAAAAEVVLRRAARQLELVPAPPLVQDPF